MAQSSPPTAAARRPGRVGTSPHPLPPSPGPPPPAEPARERCTSTSTYRTCHAHNHILTLTTATDRALHRAWVRVSPDPHELAYRVPQVYRSTQDLPTRRCRAAQCSGAPRTRWLAGLPRPLQLAAHTHHRRHGGGAFIRVGHVRGARRAAAAAEGVAGRRPSAGIARIACACRSPARDRGCGKPRAAPRRLRAGWAGPGGHLRPRWSGQRRHRP